MAKEKDFARGRKEEALLIALDLEYLDKIIRRPLAAQDTRNEAENLYKKVLFIDPAADNPLRLEQWRIIRKAFGRHFDAEFKSELEEEIHGVSRRQLLLEYTTAVLARELGELEIVKHRQSEIQFAIPGIGHEFVGVALQRHLRPFDAVSLYYRQESDYLYRGGTVWELWQMTAQRPGDPCSGGVVLAGHPCRVKSGILPTISSVGAHVLTAAGIARGLKLRRRQGINEETFTHFNSTEAISVCHIGDASMAQGEVMEALQEVLIHDGSPLLLVVNNNGGGISTDVEEGSINGDPIAAARGYERHGLKIWEVDGPDIEALYQSTQEAVAYVRTEYRPAVLAINNIYKLVHSSSDDPSRYKRPTELAAKKALDDPLPKLKQYLLELNVASSQTLDQIANLAKAKVAWAAEKTLTAGEGNPEKVYQHVFAPKFTYSPTAMSLFHPWASGELDLLQSSREAGVKYLEHWRSDTKKINMRQAITTTLAQEMARDDKIIVFGEDVADFSVHTLQALTDYFEQRLEERGDEFSSEQIETLLQLLPLVLGGKGYDIGVENFALMAEVLGGKGGVFKTTQFLQHLFGPNRVWNSRLAEASIVGTAIGYSLAGYLPIVEIQFDAYWSPAYQQIVDQLSTLRWRSGGQYSAGMVIRIQGMNRLGGVGGIGHGDVILGKLIGIPGIRTVTPADATEAGPLLREAIRLAREHQEPIIFLEPIMELNANMGYLQDSDVHLPLGEAQIHSEGQDFLVLSYGNNLPLVEKAKTEWEKESVSATIINLRTLGVQTDWQTIAPYLEKHGRVLIVETERGEGSAGANLSAQISEHFFSLLDAAPERISARNIRTPAGKKNEEYVLPQVQDIVTAGLRLARY